MNDKCKITAPQADFILKLGPSIVYIEVSTPLPPISCQAPLKFQTVYAHLFKQSPPLFTGFSWTTTPTPKSRIFQWTPKISKFFILNTTLFFKNN